jgi:uncharacterized phage-associated protein
MTTTTAHDVASAFRARFPDLGTVKLHKLLYYAQGWHVTMSGRPLFHEEVEAWVNGPVVASLWADEKYDRPRPAPEALSETQLATIDYVVNRYGGFAGKDLIRLTHSEDPWRTVSESEEASAQRNPTIDLDALGRWFAADDDYVSHRASVDRLRARTDIYSFGPLVLPDDPGDDVRAALSSR